MVLNSTGIGRQEIVQEDPTGEICKDEEGKLYWKNNVAVEPIKEEVKIEEVKVKEEPKKAKKLFKRKNKEE